MPAKTGIYKINAQEKKEQMYIKAHGKCKHCQKAITLDGCHLAHKIPSHAKYIKKYGDAIIYHEFNMDITCPDCNHLSVLNPATHPVEAARLIKEIQEDLKK